MLSLKQRCRSAWALALLPARSQSCGLTSSGCPEAFWGHSASPIRNCPSLQPFFFLFSFPSPMMNRFFPANFPNKQYQLLFTQGSGESKEEIVNYEFDTKDLVCLALSSVVGVWYLLRKHWIANNLFGLAFSLNGVELLHLNNVSTGCILLGGLFIYDVFWVFGTNVMVTVAKSFEAPIKLVFPQDLLEKGLEADNFAMLGLGDIVIPATGIPQPELSLLCSLPSSLKKNTHTYFYTSFVAYIFGLGLTIFIMHIFKHAQPALLYLVPACIGFPLLVALAKGEVTEMFRWASAGVGAVLPTALEHRKHADVPTPGHSWRDRHRVSWARPSCAPGFLQPLSRAP
uniref:Histocompatibility minor 13 n=1 Tax=Anas platyrhynchos platyrhynchos TaxID=8840 RepID=A0A493TRV9_ANAPP